MASPFYSLLSAVRKNREEKVERRYNSGVAIVTSADGRWW
jgi:hypothetical protein